MSMTWNSRADPMRRCRLALLGLTALFWIGCDGRTAVVTPPDAPMAAAPAPADRPPAVDLSQHAKPLILESVSAGALDDDLRALAGAAFLESAANPLAVQVRLASPLPLTVTTSWPVVLLNGEAVKYTRGSPTDSQLLIAFLPDRSRIKDVNTVAAEWVGRGDRTRTPEPLTFERASIDE